MSGRTILRGVVVAFGVAAGAAAHAQQMPSVTPVELPTVTLEALEQLALAKNPTLRQAAATIDAARGRARQAGLLPNPTIGYSGDEVSTGSVIRGGEHGLFIEQTIPLGGKLRLSRAIFEQEVVEADQLAVAQRMRVVTTVRTLFYQGLAAQHRVEVRERLSQVALEAVDVSQQLFNTGAADRPDVLQSEVEALREQLSLTAARNDLSRIWRALAAATGDPTLRSGRLAGSIEVRPPELDRDAILTTILQESPQLKAAAAGLARAEAALTRARREPAPDLVLRGGPRYNRELLEANARPVGWEAAFDVGVTVPLFNRNQGGIAAAVADVARAKAEVARVALWLRSRFADAFERYLTALRMTESYRDDILPRAEESHRLYLTRYRAAAAAYPLVLVAQRGVFEANETYLTAAESAWRAAIELQGLLLTGGLDMPEAPESHQ